MWEAPDELSDYELLVHFNPYFINEKINSSYDYIEKMYDYHYPHQVGDLATHTIYFESVHIESLAIEIIERKESLQKYIERSKDNLNTLKQAKSKFSKSEKVKIDKFFKTDGEYYPTQLISLLKIDIQIISNQKRKNRNRKREKQELLLKASKYINS